MKKISLLGSTGSIGTQALKVIESNNYKVVGLAANSNVKLLAEQTRRFMPECICIFDESKKSELESAVADLDVTVLSGMDGLCRVATLDSADVILNSVVGMVGLKPTLAAIEAGKDVALANKETLVTGGKLVMSAAKNREVTIYPVDSEHSAIFQSLQGSKREQLSKIILTASGGPFFGKKKSDLESVTVEQALKHPNWTMGAKITVDSATLMNKGLEFIEAMWLFDVTPDMIEIVVHRESVVHSAVEFNDGAVIAQLGVPDMKLPIQYALTYPDRLPCDTKRLSLTDYATLSFAKPDYETFDCLRVCIKAAKIGGTAPAIVNGANEAAVKLFLDGKIGFNDVGRLVSSSLENISVTEVNNLDDVLRADAAARNYVFSHLYRS